MSRLSRLYSIAESLRAAAPRLLTVATLAARHEVSTRTVQRDLQALMESGVPVRFEEGRRGGWTVDATMTLPPVNLTGAEAVALVLAAAAAGEGSPFGSAAASAVAKVSAVLDADARLATEAWASRIAVRPGAARPGVMAAVEQSLAPPRALHLIYVGGNGARSDRVVEPVGLMTARGHWYLIARCRTREADRGFRLDRIEQARCLPDTVPERDLGAVLAAERLVP